MASAQSLSLIHIYHGEAEVASVHLEVEAPDTDGWIFAQTEKLDLLFENLIYLSLIHILVGNPAVPAGHHISVLGHSDTGISIGIEFTQFLNHLLSDSKKSGVGQTVLPDQRLIYTSPGNQ